MIMDVGWVYLHSMVGMSMICFFCMVGMRMKGMSMVGIADSTKRPPPPAPLSPLPHQPLSLSVSC